MLYMHQIYWAFVNTLKIWTFHCNCPYISHFYEELPNNLEPLNIKSIPINLKFELMQHMQQITERLTTRVRIWTFHCNCLYISHFNEELPNIILAELQIISDLSEIWFRTIYAPNLMSVTNTHLIWTFHCNCPYISHFNEELPNIIVAELQIISNLSEIWFGAIYAPNYWAFCK